MTSWRAEFTGPNAMNAAATFGAWTDAADWLAAMLRVVQPERGYLEAARALTGAIPEQAFLAHAGRFVFMLADDKAAQYRDLFG